MRADGRAPNQIRPLVFDRGFTENPGGSVLVRWGRTQVVCTAMLEPGVPDFLIGAGRGWLTAEYAMLPGSTPHRRTRDSSRGKVDGRSTEIQRLIGRCLRAGVDMERFPDQTMWIDCDVLQADGGTRTASINGAWVAMNEAFQKAVQHGDLARSPVKEHVAAVSVGIVDGQAMLDLPASEDQSAEVDMNIVMTGSGEFIEVQGSAEKGTFGPDMLQRLLDLARTGITQIVGAQTTTSEESS